MTKLAYFDCFSGVSGDMVLGALVDAGVPLAELEAQLRRLSLSGWKISAEKVRRMAMAATHVKVESTESHHHRGLSKILELIDGAELAPRVAERAKHIFTRLGEAEAGVHDEPVEKVHFHEVGAVDAILDIVGACIGFELLGLEEFAASALNVGGGSVKTAHGVLPVPAPATADLLRGAPTYSTGIERELVTPTGAAIVSTLATRFGPMPPMAAAAIGCGAGAAELAEQPNVLRLFVGESAAREAGAGWDELIAVVETNVDDMNPQLYGYFVERALAAGALDVFAAPVQMKKNRPGQLLTILCEPAAVNGIVDLLFRETTTIGVRSYEARRRVLERQTVSVETPLGTVRMKVARLNGHVLNASPEFEDCQRLAAERGVPLKQVLAEAMFSFQKQSGGTQ
jgi:uncharacterized protein (TIGR00299 family) protein